MNTKILEREYTYCAPDDINEALDILSGDKPVKILAGGTDLIVKLKMGVDIPMEIMLDIKRINELDGVTRCDNDGIFIGAATRICELERMDMICKTYPALYEAALSMASPSVRNMATIGGNVLNASPVADCVGPLICYGAKLYLRSKARVRTLNIEDFFIAPGVSRAQPDELLTSIGIERPIKNTGAAFIKLGRVKSDIAKISVTALITRVGDQIINCRIAMGSVAATPIYLEEISAGLSGREFSSELAKETAQRVAETIEPIDDIRSTAEYRKDMALLLTERALNMAWARSFN